jgi:hypothetical protein
VTLAATISRYMNGVPSLRAGAANAAEANFGYIGRSGQVHSLILGE